MFPPQAVKDHPRLYGDQYSRIRPRTLICREPQITWLTSFTSLTAKSSETPVVSIVAFFVFLVIVDTFAVGSSAGNSIEANWPEDEQLLSVGRSLIESL